MRLREHRSEVRGGFTLMEILVVCAILVVLAGAAVPIYSRYLDQSRIDRARMDVQTLSQAVEAYQLHNGYPPSLAALTQTQPDGGGPTLEAGALRDPWGREYQYAAPGQGSTHNSGKADVWSLGPPNGTTIIGNWSAENGAGGI